MRTAATQKVEPGSTSSAAKVSSESRLRNPSQLNHRSLTENADLDEQVGVVDANGDICWIGAGQRGAEGLLVVCHANKQS